MFPLMDLQCQNPCKHLYFSYELNSYVQEMDVYFHPSFSGEEFVCVGSGTEMFCVTAGHPEAFKGLLASLLPALSLV